MVDRGALANGFPTGRWTLRRVQELIQQKFKITYHPKYLNRLLWNLGFSPQKPLRQVIEQDKALVTALLQREWSRIKKVSAARRNNRIFGLVWFFLSRATGGDLGSPGKTSNLPQSHKGASRSIHCVSVDLSGNTYKKHI